MQSLSWAFFGTPLGLFILSPSPKRPTQDHLDEEEKTKSNLLPPLIPCFQRALSKATLQQEGNDNVDAMFISTSSSADSDDDVDDGRRMIRF